LDQQQYSSDNFFPHSCYESKNDTSSQPLRDSLIPVRISYPHWMIDKFSLDILSAMMANPHFTTGDYNPTDRSLMAIKQATELIEQLKQKFK